MSTYCHINRLYLSYRSDKRSFTADLNDGAVGWMVRFKPYGWMRLANHLELKNIYTHDIGLPPTPSNTGEARTTHSPVVYSIKPTRTHPQDIWHPYFCVTNWPVSQFKQRLSWPCLWRIADILKHFYLEYFYYYVLCQISILNQSQMQDWIISDPEVSNAPGCITCVYILWHDKTT